ncbi:MAG TPA: HAMP domain-containing sensor histidine kinase [Terracidiphilus sp.]
MSSNMMPHAVCWSQDQNLIWTMVVSNGITFLSYLTICVTLFYLARKTRGAVARDWAFFLVGFGIFIVACGGTHLMEVITTWIPVFWISAWVSVTTAVFSAYVAVAFALKATHLGFGINDYARRLGDTENERARMEQSLVAARKLDEWNKMSAVVSHEINNPLAAIGNLLFLMQLNPELPEGVNGIVQQASDEVKRIETLTRSTLGFFRTSAGHEPVDLVSSAEAVRFLLGPTLRQRGVEMVIRSEGDCTVNAYAVETRQALLNLVRNAVEGTTRKGANVTVELTGRPDDVRVDVIDQGSGIAASVRDSLFQFGVSTKGDRGNGMGLWLVKQLVARHGGSIDVETRQDEGTRFTVIWPRQFPQVKAADESVTTNTGH